MFIRMPYLYLVFIKYILILNILTVNTTVLYYFYYFAFNVNVMEQIVPNNIERKRVTFFSFIDDLRSTKILNLIGRREQHKIRYDCMYYDFFGYNF